MILACGEPSGPPPDLTSPLIQILSPTAAAYDRDGDGLVDFEIAFTDTGSGIDPSSVEVIAARGTMNGGGGNEDLVPLYRVVQRDSTRLVMEESFPRLLHDGSNPLEVRVRDRRGNRAAATTTLGLPAAALHASFNLGIDPFFPGQSVFILPDGSKGYAVYFTRHITVFDPNGLRVLKQLQVPSIRGGFPEFFKFAYESDTGLLYLSSDGLGELAVLDTAIDEVVEQVTILTRGPVIALSRRTPELYVGLQVTGDVNGLLSVVDRSEGREVAIIDTGVRNTFNPGQSLVATGLLLTEDESKLYYVTSEGGILIVDPATRRLIRQLDPLVFGGLDAVRFGDFMYWTREDGLIGRSLVSVLDTRSDRIVGNLLLTDQTAKRLAISPSGQRVFVTTLGFEPHLLVIDASSLELRQDLLSPINTFGVAFHPDGTRAYVIRVDNQVDVFLNRE